jgi:hypothetical protein
MSIDVILPAPMAKHLVSRQTVRHVWKAVPDKPVIGLIDNAKTRAGYLLEALGRNLVKRGFAASYFTIKKPSPSVSVTQEQRAELLARAHVIVSGVGD